MNTRGMLGGVIAAVLLVACAAPGAQQRSKTCPGNSCDVEVQVVMVGGAPVVQVDFDEVRFPRGNANSTITWKLKDSPQWQFKDTSIAPHTARRRRQGYDLGERMALADRVPEQLGRELHGPEREQQAVEALVQHHRLPQDGRRAGDAGSGTYQRRAMRLAARSAICARLVIASS
jgi:hypothetical protein